MDEDSHVVLRETDLLFLEFRWNGMRRKVSESGPVLERTGNDAKLMVEFQPQSVFEEAYFEYGGNKFAKTKSPQNPEKVDPDSSLVVDETPEGPEPIPSIISEPSRLVFSVPRDFPPIAFSTEGLLSAMLELPLLVAPNARRASSSGNFAAVWIDGARNILRRLNRNIVRRLGRRVGRGGGALPEERGPSGGRARNQARPSPPNELDEWLTAIECPYRLVVSPSEQGCWVHSIAPVNRDEWVELWHTRLGVRESSGEINENPDDSQRIIRAIWARWLGSAPANPPEPFSGSAMLSDDMVFRGSLQDFDRHNIVHLSSNWKLGKRPPIHARQLMLTALGSWMNVEGDWPGNPPKPKLTVKRWTHVATFGRDHDVQVLYRGTLLPFGHESTLIKVTQRKFHPTQRGNPAYLRQRVFLVVDEPLKEFASPSSEEDPLAKAARKLPFAQVRILDLRTPDLDPPQSAAVPPDRFWPHVSGTAFQFRVELIDRAGGLSQVEMPMLWVSGGVLEDHSKLGAAANSYNENADFPSVVLNGQKIAYAETDKDTTNDTLGVVFETTALRFDLPIDSERGRPVFEAGTWPRLKYLDVKIPAVQRIAATEAPSRLVYAQPYVDHGFGGRNAAGQLLFWLPNDEEGAAAVAQDISFAKQSNRSGGFVAPDLKISGISRKFGPVSAPIGAASTFASGKDDRGNPFDCKQIFKGLGAKLFGVIDLGEVIADVASFDDEKPSSIPRFITKQLNGFGGIIDDIQQITSLKDAKLVLPKLSELISATEQLKKFSVDGFLEEIDDFRDQRRDDPPAHPLKPFDDLLPSEVSDANVPPLMRKRVNELLRRIKDAKQALEDVETLAENLKSLAALRTRLEWRPKLENWPLNGHDAPIFVPKEPLSLVVEYSSESAPQSGGNGTGYSVVASLENFDINLVGGNRFIILKFKRLEFRTVAGEKPEIDVQLQDNGIEFTGPLSFVETLRNIIPLDGFSDPPAVDVDASGITASFSVGLPSLSVGVFALENLSLGAGFVVPFVGEAMSVWFRFCEKENPALLSVSLFGGGFYFGITLDPGGIRILETALEFGANVSMDFGVASGGVSVMAGIYFVLEMEADKESHAVVIAGYFRARGQVRALGVVSICIEIYLKLEYEHPGKASGSASISVSIELFLFETTIVIECKKRFAGSSADPTFRQTFEPYKQRQIGREEMIDVNPWDEYWSAFA